MNLAEALNVALPEVPTHRAREGFPRLDPVLVAREQIEEGHAVTIIHRPGTTVLMRVTPEQWQVAQLFDGERSYEEIGELCGQVVGTLYSENDVRDFAEMLRPLGIWYVSPQEKNIALMQKLQEERRKHVKRKFKYGDVTHMQFSAWDPDAYLSAVYPYLKWLFSWWFTALTIAGFVFMSYIFWDRWDEIGRDTLRYYTFTEKSFGDVVEFWLLFFGLGFFHESSHGLTCKHFGGGVHRMGFHLIYLTPAFFVDVTEAWVYANRWQRVATIISGIWVELIFCAGATIVWWGTAPGTFVHDFSYKIMLITGVAVVVVNLNPLIKLDGYYFFSELLDVQDIKERATAYVSGLVRKHIWRLPVEVEYVPKRLRTLFLFYSPLSGLYSYMLLFVVVRFSYNVLHNFTPDWAFVPAAALAFVIFKSRIRILVNFMRTVYLHKIDSLRRWLTGPRAVIAGAAALVLLFAPLFRETVEGRFVVEPRQRAVLHAEVPGTVTEVRVSEGQKVAAGEVVAVLSNLKIESEAAQARAEMQMANLRSNEAQLRYVNFGTAQQERVRSEKQLREAVDKEHQLRLVAPFAGVVVTPRPGDRLGTNVKEGTVIAEVADVSGVKLRVFIPEFSVRQVAAGAETSLHFDGIAGPRRGALGEPRVTDELMPEGLTHKEDYKGITPPRLYAADVWLDNADGRLQDGMTGTAKVNVRRRSLARMAWQVAWEFAGRKIW